MMDNIRLAFPNQRKWYAKSGKEVVLWPSVVLCSVNEAIQKSAKSHFMEATILNKVWFIATSRWTVHPDPSTHASWESYVEEDEECGTGFYLGLIRKQIKLFLKIVKQL